MISISNLSYLLFFSDLYRSVIDVPGRIFHIASCEDNPNLDIWQQLRNTYEPDTETRKILMFPDFHGLSDVVPLIDRLTSALDEDAFPIAIAYFDHCGYQETGTYLNLILPRLTRGSVVAFSMHEGQPAAISEVLGYGGIRLQLWHSSRKDCYFTV